MKFPSPRALGAAGAVAAPLALTLLFLVHAHDLAVKREREEAVSRMSSAIGTARSRTGEFFGRVQDTVAITPAFAQGEVAFAPQALFLERYFSEILRTHPAVDTLYYGTTTGDFVLLRREAPRARNAQFAFRSVIGIANGISLVRLRDSEFHLVRQVELGLTHPFDPRRQPWFEPAVGGDRAFWTRPYLVDGRGVPALTTATRIAGGPDRPDAVVGAEIVLEPLQRLIDSLSIDDGSGYPFLLAPDGIAVSHPALRRSEKPVPALSPLDALDDPVLATAVGRYGKQAVAWNEPLAVRGEDGRDYLVVAGRLDELDDWTVGAVLPSRDWLASIARLPELAVLQALSFLLLWLLAGLLLWRYLGSRLGALRRLAERFVGSPRVASAPGGGSLSFEEAERAVEGALRELDAQRRENRRLLEESRRSERAKTLFLASMSHELRTPLTAIGGFAEIIERQLLGPIGVERYREYAGLIRRSNQRMLELVENLLDASALESGSMTLRPERTDLDRLVQEVADEQRLEASRRSLSLKVEAASGLLASVDAPKLRVLLANLLRNALTYTPPGGAVTLRLTANQSGEAEFEVLDSGVGMEPARLQELRRPFARGLEDSYVAGEAGTGLGLAIVDRIAELHRARLRFDTAPARGTRVTVTLPHDCLLPRGGTPSPRQGS